MWAPLAWTSTRRTEQHSISFGYMGVLTQLFGGRVAPTIFNFSNAMTSGPDAACRDGRHRRCLRFLHGGRRHRTAPPGFNALPATQYYLHGVYVQDDWKVTRKLTLNLGFRYEMQTPFTERHNWQAAFDFHALNPISAASGVSGLRSNRLQPSGQPQSL